MGGFRVAEMGSTTDKEEAKAVLYDADPEMEIVPLCLARLRELRDLPARIPELRRQAVEELLAQGWSRRQIAAELGISRQSVYEWDRGKS